MTPNKAYIASFSITGLLVALAVLLLVVVGALMAFREEEGPDRAPPVSEVIVGEPPPVVPRALKERAAASARAATAPTPSTRGVVLTPPAPGAPSVAGERGTGGGSPSVIRAAPVQRPGRGGPSAGASPGGSVGAPLGTVSPQVGGTVAPLLEELGGVFPGDRTLPAYDG